MQIPFPIYCDILGLLEEYSANQESWIEHTDRFQYLKTGEILKLLIVNAKGSTDKTKSKRKEARLIYICAS